MSGSDPTYNAEIRAWLQEIKPGWMVIDDICRAENREIFINAVKAYIDEDWGDVYFDSNYKKLRKIEILNLTSEETRRS